MKIGRLNHVGIAVPSIEEAWKTYKTLYGVEDKDITPIGEMETQGVKYSFVNVANSQIELIEPLGEKSPIRKFLEKNPAGGRQANRTAVAFEEFRPERMFEQLNLAAQRRLRHAQTFGGASEVQFLRDGDKAS